LIKSFEDARLVGIAAAPFEQSVSFVATIATEISVQQVNHRPKVAALFNVHLKQIAQVIKRRTGVPE